MNPTIEKAKAAPLLSLIDSEFRLRQQVKVDPSHPSVSFVWFATTLTGRQSVHQHSATYYRTTHTQPDTIEPTRFFALTLVELRDVAVAQQAATLPHLQSGYTWHGPYIVPGGMTTKEVKTLTFAQHQRKAMMSALARNVLARWIPA